MNLTLTEMETHLNMTADDRGTWQVYSDDPVLQRRLESVGATIVRLSADGNGKHYALPANQVSFRKARVLTEEQRAQYAARLRALRTAPTAMGAE